MLQHIDTQSLPASWSKTQVTLTTGHRVTLYEDPSHQFFSFTPVTSIENITEWYNARSALSNKVTKPKSVREAMKMREAMWTRPQPAQEQNYAVEEWVRVG